MKLNLPYYLIFQSAHGKYWLDYIDKQGQTQDINSSDQHPPKEAMQERDTRLKR